MTTLLHNEATSLTKLRFDYWIKSAISKKKKSALDETIKDDYFMCIKIANV